MHIKYLGHSSFKIKGKTHHAENVTVVTDPFDPKMVGLPYPKQEADVITSSHEGHGDHDWYKGATGFVINTPGEFEIKGLRIFGIKSYHDEKYGAERGTNTIFVFDFEVARVAHLGDLGHKLDSEQIESLESIDILLIPVGGTFTIDPKTAINVIEEIEPKIVIPMHYKTDKHTKTFEKLATVDDFIKEAGVTAKTLDELKIKSRSDLPPETEYVVLA